MCKIKPCNLIKGNILLEIAYIIIVNNGSYMIKFFLLDHYYTYSQFSVTKVKWHY